MGLKTLCPTDVLRHIKKHLGSVVYDIEFSDDEIMKTVFEETLPTYSKYFPNIFRLAIRRDHFKGINGDNVYTIPYVEGLAIIGVNQVYPATTMANGAFTMTHSTNPVNNQISSDMRSMYITRTTMNYIAPNKVEIFPKIAVGEEMLINVKTVHPRHMASIPIKMREHFLQLALLDVLEAIYAVRTRFENMSSPYGNINVFLSRAEQAKSERESLLDKFAQNSVLAQGVIGIQGK